MAAARRVVDTSAWIEWLVQSPLGRRLDRLIPEQSQCVVPTIVQLELAKWLTREVGEDEADRMIAYTQRCEVVPLDTPIALLAADVQRQFGLDTADAIVFATASSRGVGLLTCDARFRDLSGVTFLPKAA